MPKKGTQIFLSYSRADGEFALKLVDDLTEAGADIWIDQKNLPAGERWNVAIQRAIEASHCLIVVLSPNSVKSEDVLDEAYYARVKGKQLIPLLYQKCEIPYQLLRYQSIDFTGSYQHGYVQLCKKLGVDHSNTAKKSSEQSLDTEAVKTSESKANDYLVVAKLTFVSSDFEGDVIPKLKAIYKELGLGGKITIVSKRHGSTTVGLLLTEDRAGRLLVAFTRGELFKYSIIDVQTTTEMNIEIVLEIDIGLDTGLGMGF